VSRFDEFLAFEPPVDVEPLFDGVWTVSSERARSVFLEGATCVVAVDTLGTPGAARAYARAVAETCGKPIGWIVYTNDHLSRSGYGAALAPDAGVVAHHTCARVVAGRRVPGQLPVTRAIDSTTTVELDGVTLELVHPGPLVGTGALAVRIPAAGVIFSLGPLPNARYGLLADYHIEHYPRSIRALLGLEWDVFVPGRYRPMIRAEVLRALAYFEELQVVCQKAFADGVEIWDLRAMRRIAREKLAGSFGDLDGFEQHVGITSFRVVHHYLMGGWGLEDTQAPELAYSER
jgi:hypothetical protein